ncbi:MAG TPA: 6-phosphofructokinase [Gammaproteobacteria bacterium]|nr:6-phosphofructokinase [Gammaproteobacteria bacterium]
MEKFNALYAQSGGVTAVINATACGVIETVRKSTKINKLYAARHGIIGALTEDLIDTSFESDADIAALRHTPAGAFGSCRHKLGTIEKYRKQYERLVEVFSAHHIRYFFYNGGGDSQDTAYKVSQISQELHYPITCIGIPKTIDNDLPLTDNSPGFGSVAKYVAVSIREAGMDVASMSLTSTKIFILEVMGRHAGWIAAAAGLAAEQEGDSPHIILFPEIPLNTESFLTRVKECVNKYDHCSIVVSEGVKNPDGTFISESGLADAFGHKQLGGVAPLIAKLIKENLGYKYHWALADYLQRSARHVASKTDVEQAYAVGKTAVEMAIAGKNAVMPIIVREKSNGYRWRIGEAPLEKVANVEKKMPREFITADGLGITKICQAYLQPLIQGEDYPPYHNGLPIYVKLKNTPIAKKLKTTFEMT